ncbi:Uncharacterised protein [Clostridioides difficile]|uniref:hypothetical protein n=1 Tax=Clostridioides difficile TaxID=1496 RepID=UPI00097FD8DF|nr:hypothetical protein [Clostridioides difficile]SJT80674.1 Uncharacterised protein [Clostridioides difficile]HBG8470992.1 hypothetical protein [Clostridioides difficile]HEB5000120.1 hypothetical protein [Clostridioides difficile]
MIEDLLNEYNIKDDKEREKFIKFANLLYELQKNNKEKFQELTNIINELYKKQQERKNK